MATYETSDFFMFSWYVKQNIKALFFLGFLLPFFQNRGRVAGKRGWAIGSRQFLFVYRRVNQMLLSSLLGKALGFIALSPCVPLHSSASVVLLRALA